jgi:SprT-like family
MNDDITSPDPARPQWQQVSTPTAEVYGPLQLAFAHFNAALFDDQLPHCLVTLQRKAGTLGYFVGDRFTSMDGSKQTDEIAMNPVHFRVRTPRETASTLAHEMVHLWQHHFGQQRRRGYHDKQWAAKMIEIGLQPSSTGGPGGKITGYRVSHYVIEGGPFDLAFQAFKRQVPRSAGAMHTRAAISARSRSPSVSSGHAQTAGPRLTPSQALT